MDELDSGTLETVAVSRSDVFFVIKLLLIGDTNVGKTCLMFRLCDDTFTPVFINTIGNGCVLILISLKGSAISVYVVVSTAD